MAEVAAHITGGMCSQTADGEVRVHHENSRMDEYVGAVQEVADRAGEMRTAVSGYSITVTSGSGA